MGEPGDAEGVGGAEDEIGAEIVGGEHCLWCSSVLWMSDEVVR